MVNKIKIRLSILILIGLFILTQYYEEYNRNSGFLLIIF